MPRNYRQRKNKKQNKKNKQNQAQQKATATAAADTAANFNENKTATKIAGKEPENTETLLSSDDQPQHLHIEEISIANSESTDHRSCHHISDNSVKTGSSNSRVDSKEGTRVPSPDKNEVVGDGTITATKTIAISEIIDDRSCDHISENLLKSGSSNAIVDLIEGERVHSVDKTEDDDAITNTETVAISENFDDLFYHTAKEGIPTPSPDKEVAIINIETIAISEISNDRSSDHISGNSLETGSNNSIPNLKEGARIPSSDENEEDGANINTESIVISESARDRFRQDISDNAIVHSNEGSPIPSPDNREEESPINNTETIAIGGSVGDLSCHDITDNSIVDSKECSLIPSLDNREEVNVSADDPSCDHISENLLKSESSNSIGDLKQAITNTETIIESIDDRSCDHISETRSSNSIVDSKEDAPVPSSSQKEEYGTITNTETESELRSIITSRSQSPSDSDATLKDEALGELSPDKEISKNQNKIYDIPTSNAESNLLIFCDNTTTPTEQQNYDAVASTSVEYSSAPIRHPIVQEMITTLYSYRVDSPKPLKPRKTGPPVKSKSLDDDDIMIQEMSDTSSTGDLTDNNQLVSEASETEADAEVFEQCEKFDSRIISIQTLPLDATTIHEETIEKCQLTASESIVPSNYDDSEQDSQDTKARRARKRVALETHFMPQFLNPRYLDSIKEENSDASDSLSNRSPTLEPVSFPDLDDEVFLESGGESRQPGIKANAVFPKSNLDFSQKKKHISNLRPPSASVIREESPCVVVETKIIEPPESIEESCSGWTTTMIAQSSDAAELIYIDSASSSSSDLMELDYADQMASASARGNDYSNEDVHIETPTIEADGAKNILDSLENTPTLDHDEPANALNNSQEYPEQKKPICDANRSTKSINFSESSEESQSERLSCISNGQSAVQFVECDVSEAIYRPDFQIGGPCSNNMFATLLSPLINSEESSAIDKVITENTGSQRSEFVRQDSAGSHCSGQSQNTVINKGSSSQTDLADFDLGPCVSGTFNEFGTSELNITTSINSLRQICLEALASMPYGKVVLEELASVAESLSDLTQKHQNLRTRTAENMPYPLPDVPIIGDLVVPTGGDSPSHVKLMASPPSKLQSPPPPPIPAPPKMESWLGIPTEEDPNILVCLSPSQRDYMNDESRKTGVETTPDSLLDMHRKFIERRGYHELSSRQVDRIHRDKSVKLDQIVSSTQLRKSTTPPPPPIPPPPLEHMLLDDTIGTLDGHGDDVDDQNKHRLLAIIRDSRNQTTQQKIEQPDKRQCNFDTIDQHNKSDRHNQPENSTTSADPQQQDPASIAASNPSENTSSTMSHGQHNWDPFEFGNMDPRKRFSNIETTSPGSFCSQLKQTQPKRYSNIETSTTTSKKRIENGNVIYDTCDTTKEKFTAGEKNSDPRLVNSGSDHDGVMSDIKLDTSRNQFMAAPKQSTQLPSATHDEKSFSQPFENRKTEENMKSNSTANEYFAYDEFRRRAKENARARSEFFERQNSLLNDFDELTKSIQDDLFLIDSDGKAKKASVRARTSSESRGTYNVPIKLEEPSKSTKEDALNTEHKVFTVPISFEKDEQKDKEHTNNVRTIPIEVEASQCPAAPNSASNYSSSSQREHKLSEKRLSSQNLDEWMRYIDDLGASSDNITKPLHKEVELCIGRRSNIRAPRLSVSTSNLSTIGTGEDRLHDRRFSTSQSVIDTTPISPYVSPIRSQRKSLPKEYHDQQLNYIRQKESELQAEFDKLEMDRRHLIEEIDQMHANSHLVNKEAINQTRSCRLPTLTEEEAFRQQMHDEWLNKVAEREERRLHKIIKISGPSDDFAPQVPFRNLQKFSSTADIGDEFLKRVKERRSKLCMPSDSDWESGAESQPAPKPSDVSDTIPSVKVIEGQSERDFKHLPKHLREFAEITSQIHEKHHEEKEEIQESTTCTTTTTSSKSSSIMKDGVWSPNNKTGTFETNKTERKSTSSTQAPPAPPPPPIWSPQASPVPGRKEFRPIKFESPTFTRKYTTQHSEDSAPATPPWSYAASRPLYSTQSSSCTNLTNCSSSAQQPQYRPQSQNLRKSESVGANLAPQPTGASYTEANRPQIPRNQKPAFVRPNEVIYQLKNEYMSEPESENDRPKKMAQLGRRKFDGIGPTTKDGMPIVLRSEVKENNQHKWYKRMYNTLHKAKDDGRYPYKANGYMSEPEPNYDSDYSTMKYRTLDRRRIPSTGSYQDERSYGTMPNPVRSTSGSYKNQPGRIENYIPGRSSVSDKEKKEHLEQQKLSSNYTEGYLSRALKEQGYESDSHLVFRKKEDSQFAPLSPVEQRQAYRSVQAGGEPPLQGFRKSAPEKPKETDVVPPPPPIKGVPLNNYENGQRPESPHRYIEGDVNIHYKSPIRYEYKDAIPEEELAYKQAESMKKLYQEERRRKYLQELQDMSNRRHTDNFTPSQKSPISLHRYDDFQTDVSPKSPGSPNIPSTIARALYNFQGQTARELTFKKGDVIYIRRQIDKNWYEGEHNAMVGLLPANYVEIITKDGTRPPPPKKPSEGQARAKFNFSAQSGIELSLNKGELVTLTRRVDANWFEGKIANRKGIFPVAYVEVLTDIGADECLRTTAGGTTASSKRIGAPASHSLITANNTSPTLDQLRTNLNKEFNNLTNGQPPNGLLRETKSIHKTEVLHVDTNSEPIPYRALYNYRPQNNDELKLQEGDIVYVLEICDDGWYVGTSQQTGCFGTFPGNYVERL